MPLAFSTTSQIRLFVVRGVCAYCVERAPNQRDSHGRCAWRLASRVTTGVSEALAYRVCRRTRRRGYQEREGRGTGGQRDRAGHVLHVLRVCCGYEHAYKSEHAGRREPSWICFCECSHLWLGLPLRATLRTFPSLLAQPNPAHAYPGLRQRPLTLYVNASGPPWLGRPKVPALAYARVRACVAS